MGKALPERGSFFFFVLIEQVPDAERGLPVDLVVHSFPGVSYPSHALPPVSGNQGLLRLPLPLAVVRALRERLGLGVRMPIFIAFTSLGLLW